MCHDNRSGAIVFLYLFCVYHLYVSYFMSWMRKIKRREEEFTEFRQGRGKKIFTFGKVIADVPFPCLAVDHQQREDGRG